jgi:glycosyltransferase
MKLKSDLKKSKKIKRSKKGKPLISIITVVYNGAETIRDTIESVMNQSYDNMEHIVVDGGSTDGTIEILKEYDKYISKWISEKDKGIYDAMNKGISLCSGEYVGILNSDDCYASENILEKVIQKFKDTNADAVYGDLEYVDFKDTGKIIRYWKSSEFKQGSFKQGWHPPHPSLFIKKAIYDKFGYFDTSMKISADFELMLRYFENCRISSEYLALVIVKMRLGGASNRNIKNRITGLMSIFAAFKKNNISINKFLYLINRLLPKIKQYWQRKL